MSIISLDETTEFSLFYSLIEESREIISKSYDLLACTKHRIKIDTLRVFLGVLYLYSECFITRKQGRLKESLHHMTNVSTHDTSDARDLTGTNTLVGDTVPATRCKIANQSTGKTALQYPTDLNAVDLNNQSTSSNTLHIVKMEKMKI